MKQCSNCSLEKDESEFHWRNKTKDLKSSWCKVCVSTLTKQRHENNPEYFRNRNKIRRRRLQEWLSEQKSKPCLDCGNCFPPICMDFDHIGNDKEGNIAYLINATSFSKVKEEIAKCEVVCSNCHRIRTYKRRMPL